MATSYIHIFGLMWSGTEPRPPASLISTLGYGRRSYFNIEELIQNAILFSPHVVNDIIEKQILLRLSIHT